MTAQIGSKNIVITGFMGTGKSTVGQMLAARLGRRFVDMDVILSARAGKAISAIFAEEGEAVFRAPRRRCARNWRRNGAWLSARAAARW